MARKPSKLIQDSSSFRVLPQNVEAEESLLSAILLDNDVLMDVVEIISPLDFYKTAHQQIFEAIIELSQKNDPIDAITLANFLKKKGKLENIGGAAYLAGLLDVPMALNPAHYAKIIREKASLRRLIEKAGEITRKCFEDQGDVEDIIDFAESAIFKISEDKISPSFFHISKIIENNVDALEERQGSNALVTGVSTGFTDFDRMTAGLQNSDLIILAARPSMGKCCEADTEIVLEDGSIATIEDIFQHRQAKILTLDKKLKFHITEPSDRIDDGKKPVFRVITALGRCIETTLPHPFLTPKGWKSLEKLQICDKIAVARKIDIFGKEVMRECEVRLLAYLIGDGNLTNITPGFSNSNSLISDDFAKALEEFGETETGTLTLWLKNLGIYGKDSHNKFIIPPIFRLPRHLLALFLNRVFASGGWISTGRGAQTQLSYASVSEKLTRQIQHLLLRFGILSTLRKHRSDYTEAIRFCWQLDICDEFSVKMFIEEIGIFAASPADTPKYKKSAKPAPNDIYWDKIVSIEFAGEKQVYDLTIPDTHNFLANDICVHNTALALNIARNAAIDAEVPVAVFSLEMSKEQLSLRMLCAEARLDSSKLRGGFFSNDDWVRLTDAAGNLSEAPIFIDDTASISVVEIRAKARRLKMEKGLGLILIDYLQLMRGRADAERRDLEISEISRALKALAKELNVPVVALSQLNRKLEERSDRRPILSDLRESGCLSGDSKVVLSGGKRMTIREIADQKHNVEVFAMNEKNLKTTRMNITNAFSTGVRSVYRLETASGRQIKATANHKFRTLTGWNRLDRLKIGEHIAVPRKIESFTDIAMKNGELALLGHLIGDGCTLPGHLIQYTTNMYCGTSLYKSNMSRERAALAVKSPILELLSDSDIYWDKIHTIEYVGEEETFDLSVPVHHNFIANDIFVHNSLEQDADVVAFIYRDEVYNKEENNPNAGKAELIIAKQRNGPIGTVPLTFLNVYTRFENAAGDYDMGD